MFTKEWRRCPECKSLLLGTIVIQTPGGWYVKKLVCQPFGHVVDILGSRKNIP